MSFSLRQLALSAVLAGLCSASNVFADEGLLPDRGKLLLTGGFSSVEGAGGGGLATWSLISGYGSNRSWGANSHYTWVAVDDFELDTVGVAVGILDRVELSYARQDFEITGPVLTGLEVSQDVTSLKVRLFGDAVYTQGSWVPQIAIGVQHKSNGGIENAGALTSPLALGARDDEGIDYLLSATKIVLDKSFLVNATVRFTEANQFGLLGFGGDRNDKAKAQLEASFAYLLSRSVAVGGEFRTKPRNLSVDNEGDSWDVFVAWAPNKSISVLAAWVDLGEILSPVTLNDSNQQGAYISVQAGF